MHRPAVWLSRVSAIALIAMLGAFALDALDSSAPFTAQLQGFAIHLAPAVLVLLALVLAWRAPGLGAICYLLLACGYVALGRGRAQWSWYAVIVIPLLCLAALNAMLWYRERPQSDGAT